MTANFRTAAADLDHARAPQSTSASRSDAPRPAPLPFWQRVMELPDRRVFPCLVVALLLMYGLLQNPYWVPAGDSEVYAAAARNLARGEGYTFNGQPIAIIPPGWSWMMAAVMKVSPYFLPLKLLAMTCMTASLLCGYWVVRRFVTPAQAASVILLTAILSHVYQATYWLISESAFCLATTGAVLLAMQIAEGRKQPWRIGLLLFCCVAAVTIRWAGLANIALVIGALLDGQWKPRLKSAWVAAALVVFVTGAAFLGWRWGLSGDDRSAAADIATGTAEEMSVPLPPEAGQMISGAANQTAKAYQLFPKGSYADRFVNWGHWFTNLYWQPFRAAGGNPKIALLSTLLGWTLIALLGVLVVAASLQKRWLWLGTGMYAGALAIGWTNVNARYYMPIAFLITLGVFLATDQLLAWRRGGRAWRVTIRTLFVLFVGSVAACNAALYAVEVSIARSGRFYQKYETGMNESIIAACQHLASLPPGERPGDGEVAVSQRYTNLGRSKASPFGLRTTVLLTGREIVTPRFKDTNVSPSAPGSKPQAIRKWLRSKGVKYYLWQPEISPWRVWHFRMGWLEKAQRGYTAERDTSGWQLFRVEGDDASVTRIPLPRRCEPVRRVPGL